MVGNKFEIIAFCNLQVIRSARHPIIPLMNMITFWVGSINLFKRHTTTIPFQSLSLVNRGLLWLNLTKKLFLLFVRWDLIMWQPYQIGLNWKLYPTLCSCGAYGDLYYIFFLNWSRHFHIQSPGNPCSIPYFHNCIYVRKMYTICWPY